MFKMQQETAAEQYQQTSSLSQFGPTLALKEGIDISALTRPDGAGAELEFQTEDLENDFQEMNIESNKAYFEGMQNITRMFDNESDEENDSDLSWFHRMTLKMNNLTEDGGVKKMIKKEGVGIVVPAGAKIRAHYDGYLEDLDEPFDSSRLRQKELQMTLDKGEVVPGLDIGLASMRVNEVARFLVKPSYAYGKMGCPPRIPGGASILFEVELLAFTEASALDDYQEMSEEERREISFEKTLAVAKASHALGNDFYARELFGKAIRKYMNSINTLETANLKNEDEENQVVHNCIKSYLNMALCNLKLGNFGKSVASGRRVLSLQPKHPKALYICGKSLRHLKNFSEARRYLLKARGLAPKSKDIAVELRTLDELEAKVTAVEKDMCKKMFA